MHGARVSLARVTADLARAAGLPLLGAIVLAAPSCCIVVLPIFLTVLGRTYERAMGVRLGPVSRWRLGLAGTPVLLVPVVSYFVASILIETPSASRSWAPSACSILVSAALTCVVFPHYGAPFEAIQTRSGLLRGMVGSSIRAARRGVGPTLAHAAAVGAIGALPWLLVPALHLSLSSEHAAKALLPALGAAVWLASLVGLAITAHFWSGGVERFGDARAPGEPSSPSPEPSGTLGGSVLLVASPIALVTAALLVAMLTPTPMGRTIEPALAMSRAVVTLPHLIDEGTGLTLSSPRDDVLHLETRGGGGAGDVRAPGLDETTLVVTADHGPPVRFTVRGRGRDEDRVLSFDARGVRTDDAPLDRITARLGGTVPTAAGTVYLVLLLALVLAQTHRAALATGLEQPTFRGRRELAVIEGRLRTERRLELDRGQLVVTGEAHLDLGELGTARLPEGRYPVLAADDQTSVGDDAVLSVIATFEPSMGSPFRDATPPIPKDARLVIGPLATAQAAFRERRARLNVMLAIPMLAIALLSSAAILLRL